APERAASKARTDQPRAHQLAPSLEQHSQMRAHRLDSLFAAGPRDQPADTPELGDERDAFVMVELADAARRRFAETGTDPADQLAHRAFVQKQRASGHADPRQLG